MAVIAARDGGAGVASGSPDPGDEGLVDDDAEDDGSGGSPGGGVALVTGNDIRSPSDAVTRLADLCLLGGALSGFGSAVWTNNSGQPTRPFPWFDVVRFPGVGTKQPPTRRFDDGR
ncbi:hypothetical protein ACWCHM_15500 [Micromonospora sp. SCSIO 07396]